VRCRDFLNTGPVSITTRSFSLSLVNLHGIAETIYVIPDKRPVIVRDAIESGGWRTYENQYRRKDGRIINCILELRSYTNPASGRTELEGFIVKFPKANGQRRYFAKVREVIAGSSTPSRQAICILDARTGRFSI
jgi:hypothetical protein